MIEFTQFKKSFDLYNKQIYISICMENKFEKSHLPANIYLFKVNNRHSRKRNKICSWRHHDVVLVFSLLTFNIFHTFSTVSIADFEQVDVSWVSTSHPNQRLLVKSQQLKHQNFDLFFFFFSLNWSRYFLSKILNFWKGVLIFHNLKVHITTLTFLSSCNKKLEKPPPSHCPFYKILR